MRVMTRSGFLPVLLRPKIATLRHYLRPADQPFSLRPLVLTALATGFCVLTFFVFRRVLLYFRSVELFGDLLAAQLLGMILLTFFSILLISNIIASLTTFFLAEDLNLILARPVTFDRLYYARLAETLFHSSWMVLFFGLPIFIAYGWVYGASLPYYLTTLGILLPFLVIPAALGTLFSTVLVNLFPAHRTKEVLLLLFIFLGVTLYFLLRFLQPERLVNPDSFAGLVEYMTALSSPSWTFLPSYWASESLIPFFQRERPFDAFFLGLLWSTAGAMVVFGNWIFRRMFFEGWSRSQEGRKARFTRLLGLEAFLRSLTFPFHPRVRALATKDTKIFLRDASQWSQLILLAALVVVYLYNFRLLPLDKTPLPSFYLQNLVSFLNMGLAGFVLAAVGGRFVFPAVSLEGFSFWIIRSSPVPLRVFLWCKFWVSLIPLLALAETLILLSNFLLQVSSFMMVLSAITLFCITFGIAGLGIGMGALYPRFKFENTAQIASGYGGILYMILSLLFIGAIVVLEAWPVYVIFMKDLHHLTISPSEWAKVFLSFVAAAVLNGAAVVVPMRIGLKRMEERDV